MLAANRAEGRVVLSLAAAPGGARRNRTYEEGSLRVRFPAVCTGTPEAVLINTAGGIAGGDRFAVELELEANARLAVTTAAAEKIYRSLGPDARIDVMARLADGAELIWLPQETILFDRGRLARTITVTLAATARLLLAESIVFGRAAMGETVHHGHLSDTWRIRRAECPAAGLAHADVGRPDELRQTAGRLVFAENFQLDGAIADRLKEAAIANGHAAIGTLIMVPGDAAAVAAVRAVAATFWGEVGISAWNGIALARIAAPDGAALRHDFIAMLTAIGRSPLPRLWLN
jgi:urease accessory protein